MSRPTKLISGCSSCGIITLSLTLISGGLSSERKNTQKHVKIKLCGITARIQDSLVILRRLVVWIDGYHPLDSVVALFLQLLALAILSGVHPFAITGIDGLWRRRPATIKRPLLTPEQIFNGGIYMKILWLGDQKIGAVPASIIAAKLICSEFFAICNHFENWVLLK